MDIVYYYVVYINEGRSHPDIRLQAFPTQKKAESFKAQADERFKDKIIFSTIKKVDLSKHKEGIWLK